MSLIFVKYNLIKSKAKIIGSASWRQLDKLHSP